MSTPALIGSVSLHQCHSLQCGANPLHNGRVFVLVAYQLLAKITLRKLPRSIFCVLLLLHQRRCFTLYLQILIAIVLVVFSPRSVEHTFSVLHARLFPRRKAMHLPHPWGCSSIKHGLLLRL